MTGAVRYAVHLWDGQVTRLFATTSPAMAGEAERLREAGEDAASRLGPEWTCSVRPLDEAIALFKRDLPPDVELEAYPDGAGEEAMRDFYSPTAAVVLGVGAERARWAIEVVVEQCEDLSAKSWDELLGEVGEALDEPLDKAEFKSEIAGQLNGGGEVD